jgi:hypothetical protein
MDQLVSQMTTECEISHNHTIHIYKNNLNTQSNEILQINPYSRQIVVPIYSIQRRENLFKHYDLFVKIRNSSTE